MIEPMHQAVRAEVVRKPGVFLNVIDWSTLSFGHHVSKTDRVKLTHDNDVGYDLTTALIVRGDDGSTVAPVMIMLTNADGVLSTRNDVPPVDLCHVDQTLGIMQHVRDIGFDAPIVHVIDREADSVNHWRQWNADGHLVLVRAKDRVVLHDDRETTLITIADAEAKVKTLSDRFAAWYYLTPNEAFKTIALNRDTLIRDKSAKPPEPPGGAGGFPGLPGGFPGMGGPGGPRGGRPFNPHGPN